MELENGILLAALHLANLTQRHFEDVVPSHRLQPPTTAQFASRRTQWKLPVVLLVMRPRGDSGRSGKLFRSASTTFAAPLSSLLEDWASTYMKAVHLCGIYSTVAAGTRSERSTCRDPLGQT